MAFSTRLCLISVIASSLPSTISGYVEGKSNARRRCQMSQRLGSPAHDTGCVDWLEGMVLLFPCRPQLSHKHDDRVAPQSDDADGSGSLQDPGAALELGELVDQGCAYCGAGDNSEES